MDKQYSDDDVRGQRSILTDNDKNNFYGKC